MSFKERMNNAANKAALTQAKTDLAFERTKLSNLGDVVTNTHSFTALVGRKGENLAVMLPLNYEDSNDFLLGFSDQVSGELAKYSPQEGNMAGFLVYELTKKMPGRFPSNLKFDFKNLKFDIEFLRIDTELDQYIPSRRGGGYGRGVNRPMATEVYMPEVKKGFEFEARYDNGTSGYHLIALSRSEGGNRQFFPGFGIPFEVQYAKGRQITTHVTCAPKNVAKGAYAGTYFTSQVKKIASDLGLKHHDVLKFRVEKPGEVYRITDFSR